MNAWPNQILIKSTSACIQVPYIYRRIESGLAKMEYHSSRQARRWCVPECLPSRSPAKLRVYTLMLAPNFRWINVYIDIASAAFFPLAKSATITLSSYSRHMDLRSWAIHRRTQTCALQIEHREINMPIWLFRYMSNEFWSFNICARRFRYNSFFLLNSPFFDFLTLCTPRIGTLLRTFPIFPGWFCAYANIQLFVRQ